jgi:hypothetical protein
VNEFWISVDSNGKLALERMENAMQNFGNVMQNFGSDLESMANEVQRTAEIANKNIDYENEILCIKCNPSLNFFQKRRLIKQLRKQQKGE